MNVMVVVGNRSTRARIVEALDELTGVAIGGEAADVRGALVHLVHMPPEVVVCAAELGDGTCFDVLEAVQRCEPMPSVIVLGDTDHPTQGHRALLAGAAMYLPRTAGFRELQAAVAAVVEPRQVARRQDAADRFALVGRLAAGVAHDMNNYLQVVDFALDRSERGDADAPKWIAKARVAADSAVRLNRNVLVYARGGGPEPEAVELDTLVRRVLAVFARSISDRVTVAIDIDDDLPAVRGNAAELEQLVLNLVLNACDAMAGGGVLQVRAERDGAAVRLEISDTGRGLALAADGGELSPARRICDGLGLGIVRGVVERHQGRISLAPRADGGTRVLVHLPLD